MPAKLTAMLAAVLIGLVPSADLSAQTAGVNVQVSGGKRMPTTAQLQLILNPGDYVRGMLGWAPADPYCNLHTDPALQIKISAPLKTLFAAVQATGGRNFVTLGFNNRRCGQTVNSGAKTFPNTPELRAEFAAYAAAVVRQVPAIGGISIWNELNGTWNGGYTNRAAMLTDYCALANAVIAAVRQVDPDIPIAVGATVGWNIGSWFTDLFDTYGCAGKGDPTIWLDVHPYLSGASVAGQSDWSLWNQAVTAIRADGITNPLAATEWGASAAHIWSTNHPDGDYIGTFNANVIAQDSSWAATMWFEMLYDRSHPNAGLFDETGSVLTNFGLEYLNAFKP